jgi:hypothetical protein
MLTDVMELENLLKKELDVFLKLEEYTVEKKKHLIKSDMDNLRNIDIEIEKLGILIKNMELKKSEILSKSHTNQNLTAVINNMQDKNSANKLTLLKEKIKKTAVNIHRQNNINAQLIEHSLKLIENTVNIISNALMPESSSYNSHGKVPKKLSPTGVSSIIQEA